MTADSNSGTEAICCPCSSRQLKARASKGLFAPVCATGEEIDADEPLLRPLPGEDVPELEPTPHQPARLRKDPFDKTSARTASQTLAVAIANSKHTTNLDFQGLEPSASICVQSFIASFCNLFRTAARKCVSLIVLHFSSMLRKPGHAPFPPTCSHMTSWLPSPPP